MLMPTAFAPFSIVSVNKNYMGGGAISAKYEYVYLNFFRQNTF